MANPNILQTTSIYAGNAAWNLTTALTADLITAAADVTLKINNIIATNTSATVATNLSIDITGLTTSGITGVTITSGIGTINLAKAIPIPGSDVLSVIDKPIYLMEGDILRGGASIATCHLFISYEVINDA